MSTDPTNREITERLADLLHFNYGDNRDENSSRFEYGHGDTFEPLNSLDDARLCEEKLREMGLGREYSTHLFGKVLGDDGDKSLDEFGGIEYDRGLIAYATARQKCLAMLATLDRVRNH